MKQILIIFLALFTAYTAFSQAKESEPGKKEIRKIKKSEVLSGEYNRTGLYDHEFNAGGRLNTNGWSVYLEYERRTSETTNTLFQFEVGEIKHPKENKRSYATPYQGPGGYVYYASSRPFVYGKENVFYQVRLGIGQRRLIGGKGNKNGVEVSAVYMGGVVMGLAKPYYLELTGSSAGTSFFAKYTPETANIFLNPNNIIAGGGFKRGWDEVKVIPGAYGRLGMRFDWAEFNKFVSALEVGLDAQIYSKEVQIMVNNPSRRFFYGAYVSLLLGKRW